eukprot:SAG22_NODE_270_length_13234_cov_13.248573_1_plen_193_part_00
MVMAPGQQKQLAPPKPSARALATVVPPKPNSALANRADAAGGKRNAGKQVVITSPSNVSVHGSNHSGSGSGFGDEEVKMRVLVVGGTGLQGSAVVRQLLALDKFKVVVMTRNTDTAQTAAMREQDVTIVKGDMDDPLGLDRAFGIASGAMPGVHPTPGALHGVFCVVNYWVPSPDGQREILQAKNVVNAAKR